MKVILTKDTPGVGSKGALKDVSEGYAMNYLIPTGRAVQATEAALKAREETMAAQGERIKEQQAADASRAKQLKGAVIRLPQQASDRGHLYKQISRKDIVEGIAARRGITLPEDAVHLDVPIKTLGFFKVELQFGTERVPIDIEIVPEED